MEIKIGVRNVSREITLESNASADEVVAKVSSALAGDTLELEDDKGRRIVVPSAAIGYVEIGTEEKRRVGFTG